MKKRTIENYVEVLYNLEKKNKKVHTNDVASALDINPASVTEIFQKLCDGGYINYEKYSGVTLTDKGRKLAVVTQNKHESLKDFLLILGVDKKTAERDACEMEHILDSDTMDTIVKFVEIMKRCAVTPFWLSKLKKYVKTGEYTECPPEICEICIKYVKDSKKVAKGKKK